jgi:hypothetical protein
VIAGTVTFYSVVVFVHVAAVVAGLGVVFSYPVFMRLARERHPRSLAYLLGTMDRVGGAVIAPSLGLILVTGLYMTITEDGGYGFDILFVQVGLPIVIALMLMGALFFGPTEKRLAEMAGEDISAAGGGEVVFSAEFEALWARLITVSRVSMLLIVVALFFMVVKP